MENKYITFTSKLSNFEVMNSEFIRCKCYALASGDNINGSDITIQAIDNAIARGEFYNKPVVAHLYEEDGKWRVGGHDCKWVITDTKIEMINECIPFGTIPESCNLHKEEILEADGETVNTYVVMDLILWVGRYNIMDAAYSDDVYFNQSCELSVNQGHYKENDIYVIDDFTFSALCLLNKSDIPEDNVKPCFGSCRVEKKTFSINEHSFKRNYKLLLENLKKYSLENKDIKSNTPNTNISKGEKKMELSKFADVLSTIKIDETGNSKYSLLDVTDTKVFALDIENYKPYGFDYAITKENDVDTLVVDFDSKVEMSLSATEKIKEEGFSEFNIQETIDSIVERNLMEEIKLCSKELEAEFNKKFNELKEHYETLNAKYVETSEKLSKYQIKEAEVETEKHRDDINALFNKYAERLGKCSDFLVYKARVDVDKVSVDEVQEKLTLMLGKYTMDSQTKKNFSYQPQETRVWNKNNDAKNRYGNLLDKFLN